MFTGLGDLPGGSFGSSATDVSADGSTVVGYGTVSGATSFEAFRWTSGSGMIGLGSLPGGIFFSWANAVSADGSTAVGYSSIASASEAFRWTSGEGMVGLGDLPGGGVAGDAYGVSADGSKVVGWSESALGSQAFVWDAVNGIRELDRVLTSLGLGPVMAGWTLDRAWAISDDGVTIVGSGINPSGQAEAWLAVAPEPVPVPSMGRLGLAALGALLLAAACLAHRRR